MNSPTSILDLSSLLSEAEALQPQMITWRRHLHMYPEVAFQEYRTSAWIAERLGEISGITVTRPTETSVLGVLNGDVDGPVLAIRADIDALPIKEENEVSYRSTEDGKMHACGHDAHTSIVLALATLLARHAHNIRGSVRFIFQHAEELAPGGAEELVNKGVMDGVDNVIGLHVWSMLPFGKIGLISGRAMAAPDTFECHITGKGGHAAAPHETVDPIPVAAAVVTGLQNIVSRAVDPLDSVVVSVTQFIAGTTFNVIPNSAYLAGTVRTFDEHLRIAVPKLMERVIKGTAEAHGASYTFSYERGYRPVVNDPALTERLRTVVSRTFGDEFLAEPRPFMGGEDFSAYQQKAPGVFAFIGASNHSRGILHPHHHPQFDIDERSLDVGLRYLVAASVDLLS